MENVVWVALLIAGDGDNVVGRGRLGIVETPSQETENLATLAAHLIFFGFEEYRGFLYRTLHATSQSESDNKNNSRLNLLREIIIINRYFCNSLINDV